MRYTLNSANVSYNGTWQHIKIPLKDFTEQGSWDNNTWYNPEGKFDWSKIDRFEIDSEYGNMGSADLWFDDIRIVNPNAVFVKNRDDKEMTFKLSQNYPNPFNPSTTITYSLPKSSFVTLTIYDLLGREIATLVNEEKLSGTYNVTWNAENISSGVYFYKITAGGYSKVNKMVLLK
jgi:Secretion system C-terminal sorting domain